MMLSAPLRWLLIPSLLGFVALGGGCSRKPDTPAPPAAGETADPTGLGDRRPPSSDVSLRTKPKFGFVLETLPSLRDQPSLDQWKTQPVAETDNTKAYRAATTIEEKRAIFNSLVNIVPEDIGDVARLMLQDENIEARALGVRLAETLRDFDPELAARLILAGSADEDPNVRREALDRVELQATDVRLRLHSDLLYSADPEITALSAAALTNLSSDAGAEALFRAAAANPGDRMKFFNNEFRILFQQEFPDGPAALQWWEQNRKHYDPETLSRYPEGQTR